MVGSDWLRWGEREAGVGEENLVGWNASADTSYGRGRGERGSVRCGFEILVEGL